MIDDFGLLGTVVRNIVTRYLAVRPKRGEQQVWVMFERTIRSGARAYVRDSEPIGARELSALHVDDRFALWLCRQEPLTKAEKQRLLQVREGRVVHRDDVRLRQRSVRRLVDRERITWQGNTPELPELEDLSPAELRAFSLLAVAAAVTDPASVDAADLDAIARGTGISDPQLVKLLREWFPPGEQGVAAIESAFDAVARGVSAQLHDPVSGRVRSALRVRRSYSDALCTPTAWSERVLPSQDLAHAFWALYEHRQLMDRRQWSAPVADRLVSHLRAIREPSLLRNPDEPALADRLFDVALDAAEASLALCVEGLVPDSGNEEGWRPARSLYQQARLLLAVDDGPIDLARTRRLLTSAWRAFMLTGESGLALLGGRKSRRCDEFCLTESRPRRSIDSGPAIRFRLGKRPIAAPRVSVLELCPSYPTRVDS